MRTVLRTFSIQTLGCKVNQYESDQIATLLRSRGLRQVSDGGDLRIVNTCSVTAQAASKSRQTVRRAARTTTATHRIPLPVLSSSTRGVCDRSVVIPTTQVVDPSSRPQHRPRVIVTGCWATSDRAEALGLPGVDAVLGHHDDVAGELDRYLAAWGAAVATNAVCDAADSQTTGSSDAATLSSPAESMRDVGRILKGGTPAGDSRGRNNGVSSADNKSHRPAAVNGNLINFSSSPSSGASVKSGTISLPLLSAHQTGHQRAFLKVQDGCDAHCTYCIIPQLRPRLWSKPIDDAVREAQALVDAGHLEIVLTGIFLGAYGHGTALRRRQHQRGDSALGELIDALCRRVRGLRRLRLSSLEPGDLTADLLTVLKSHPHVVPHFHLPLQSGSERLLRRMNRQYTRDDFVRMIDAVNAAFDRPALTTDIIVGFPGESDAEFSRTLDLVDRARFIHIHAFSYSPRPRTAAAR
jgi:tRNA A37 methylthiotransferase MiaB